MGGDMAIYYKGGRIGDEGGGAGMRRVNPFGALWAGTKQRDGKQRLILGVLGTRGLGRAFPLPSGPFVWGMGVAGRQG